MSDSDKLPGRQKRTPEQQRFILGLRSSSAAQPHRNKKAYDRKVKHRGSDGGDEGWSAGRR